MKSYSRERVMLCALLIVASATVTYALAAADTSVLVEAKSLEECAGLGFQREVVRCQHCETLLAHTGSTDLHQECLGCCTAESDEKEVVYTSAKIVSPFLKRLMSTPSFISSFIESYEKEPYFAKLSFVDAGMRLTLPELILLSDNGEELHIQLRQMEAHQLHEVLQKKLTL